MKKETETQPAHHPYGMSQWPAMLECPRFEGRGDSKDAAAGTRVHEAFARRLVELRTSENLSLDLDANIGGDFHERGAYMAATRVFKMWEGEPGAGELWIEKRVELESAAHGTIFGTADAYWVNLAEKTVTVVDFKTFKNAGRDYMPQLMGYGLALARKIAPEGVMLRTIVVFGDTADTLECANDMRAAERLLENIELAIDNRGGGKAEPHQCNWCEVCRHFPTCAACVAVAKRQEAVAKKELNWDALPAERKAQYCAMADWMSKWADAVKAKAKEDLVAGRVIEDAENGISYTLQTAAGRKTPRVNDLWPAMRDRGVTAEDFRSALTLSASAAEGLLKATGLKAKEAKALVAEYCDESAGTVRMVRAK